MSIEYLTHMMGWLFLPHWQTCASRNGALHRWCCFAWVPICSSVGTMWTSHSALDFTSAGQCCLWAACTEISADIRGSVLGRWSVVHAVSHSGFERHPKLTRNHPTACSLNTISGKKKKKRSLSREMKFLMVSLTVSYIPGRLLKYFFLIWSLQHFLTVNMRNITPWNDNPSVCVMGGLWLSCLSQPHW